MKKRLNGKIELTVCLLVLAASYFWQEGCRVNSLPVTPPADTSLYGRIGGQYGVGLIVDSLMSEIKNDSAIAHYFVSVDTATFKSSLRTQLCQLTGGPCTYTGLSMKDAHHGMGISNSDFNAFITDYLNAMNSVGVAPTDQQDVLNLLLQYQSDIVGQ
ncbi:MAG TPA: group 1 truncated hemoglobin [Candidatus Kapabacteria bacterium]|nr:group 1 truncated hemoglobin [Candidatus Kapabacteria bacterium]